MALEHCETCFAVAAGGRIRLTDRSADMLLDLVRERRNDYARLRRLYIDNGNAEATRAANDQLKMMDVTIEEIRRTQSEMGWLDDGQPQRSHS